MNRRSCFIALLVSLLPYLVSDARAQVFDRDYLDQSNGVLKASAGLFSDRMFRGQNLYDGTSIQGALELGIGSEIGLTYVGGFVHLSNDRNHGAPNEESFNEFDFELGHRFQFDEMQLGLGHRWYTYSRTTARLQDTGEFFAELTTGYIGHPHLSFDYDHDEFEGLYYETGLEQPIPLGLNNERDAIVPSVTIGLSSGLDEDSGDHAIYDDGGIAFVEVGVKGIFGLTEGINLEPSMKYVEDIDDATTSDFVFGMALTADLGAKRQ